jgi:Flp pilus assembly protein TadB
MIIALLGAAATWFAVLGVLAYQQQRHRTDVEKRRDLIAAQQRKAARLPIRERLPALLHRFGWDGDWFLPALGASFGYLLCASALTFLGVNSLVGIALSIPLSFAVVQIAVRTVHAKKKTKFQQQLVQALDLFAAQLQAGSGPARAIMRVAPSLPDPLREELIGVIEQTRTGRTLSDAMSDVRTRYPSRAMNSFVATLKLDEMVGGRMAPALEAAAASVRRDFELTAEANAEVAQEKMQFYFILAALGFIGFTMMQSFDDNTRSTLTSGTGMLMLGVGLLNAAIGVWRALKLFNDAKVVG